LLERLTLEKAGEFLLARVDVDRNPQIAAALGVSSIPMVIGFRDGRVAAEFVGALPEQDVREFLQRVLPSEAEVLAREGAGQLEGGDAAVAEATFRRALELDGRCDPALFGLARVLAGKDEPDAALGLLDRVGAASSLRLEADRLAAQIRLQQSGGTDVAGLRAKVAASPDDLGARTALAQALAAGGQYEPALQEYLEVVRRDRSYQDGAARKAMLDIFEVVGSRSDLAERYRAELAKVLFA
jgi:putative thioredoxin